MWHYKNKKENWGFVTKIFKISQKLNAQQLLENNKIWEFSDSKPFHIFVAWATLCSAQSLLLGLCLKITLGLPRMTGIKSRPPIASA